MDILYKKTDEVVPYFQNPRVISETAINEVAKSIKQHGFQQCIVIDENNVVVAGHTRLLAAKQLGMEEVPCKIYKDSEDQINAYRLADNKVGELTTWEDKTLQIELDKLTGMEVAGFQPEQMDFVQFDDSQSNVDIEEPQAGYHASDLTQLVPITFYLDREDREEIMEKLEKVRDNENLQTKSNALLFIMRKL
tara:strand:+ start:8977 stop:9555 length:579 start_codon:yes stop_codon:yes gene_type:complete